MIVTIEDIKRARQILRSWQERGVTRFRCHYGSSGKPICEPCEDDGTENCYEVPEEHELFDIDVEKYESPFGDEVPFKPATDRNPAINAMAAAIADGWRGE